METVFITRATFANIIKQIDPKQLPQTYKSKPIFDFAKIDYLYNSQTEEILALKYIIENPNELLTYQKTKELKDSGRFLVKTSNPKFHLLACENIHSKFQNMYIPKQIAELGQEKIDEFRNYMFSEFGKFSIERYKELSELIASRVNLKFKVEITPSQLFVNEDNSGVQTTKDLSLEDLKEQIIQFANQYHELCKIYPDIFPKYTLKAFLSKTPNDIKFVPLNYFKNDNRDEFIKILNEFYLNTQMPTFEALRQFYMIAFNPELKFEGRLMEQLGLTLCAKCQQISNN